MKEGHRQGRNEIGENWQEKWSSNGKESLSSWSRENDKDNGAYKWGEGELSEHLKSIKKFKWHERKDECSDYWEKNYEEEITYMKDHYHSSGAIREGRKEYRNNRGYSFEESWTENGTDGLVNVRRTTDDGLGTRKTEDYQGKWENNQLVYEFSDHVIDAVGENKKILVNKGRKGLENGEWENTRIINFRENFEQIENRGRDSKGTWKEAWYEKGDTKWARKEGESFETKD
jgi:hypothetical protein